MEFLLLFEVVLEFRLEISVDSTNFKIENIVRIT
jgi:hypothetical protein